MAPLLTKVLALCAVGAGAAASPPTVRLRNGVEMPLLAAGTWQYNSTVAFQSVTDAIKAGFTMVDTALDYGNQDGVGKALAQFPREKVFVETKVPGCMMGRSTLNPLKCYENTQNGLQKDLELLNVDYIDLVILHFPPLGTLVTHSCNSWSGSCQMVRSQWKAMQEFYKAGKAKAIGVSNYCPSCFDCLEDFEVQPMVNQVKFHIGMGPDPEGFVSYHKEKGIVLQGYSVLGNWISKRASDEILKGNLTTSIGKAHGKSSIQVALKWIVDKGIPAVTKSSNPAHLASDLDLWSWDLTDDERSALDAATKPSGSPSFSCSSSEAIVV